MLNTPTAQKIAQRVFADVAGHLGGVDGALAALTTIHQRLDHLLVPVVGEGGFRAIFARSTRRSRTVHPCLDGVALSALAEADRFLEPLLSRLRTEEADTIRATTVAIMVHFIELLNTLVGSELTLTLLGREWPAAVADALMPTEKS